MNRSARGWSVKRLAWSNALHIALPKTIPLPFLGSLFEKYQPSSNDRREASIEKRDGASGHEDVFSHRSHSNGTPRVVEVESSPQSVAPIPSHPANDSTNPFLDTDYINSTSHFTSPIESSPERDIEGSTSVHNGDRRESTPDKDKKKRKKRAPTPTKDARTHNEHDDSSTAEKKPEANG